MKQILPILSISGSDSTGGAGIQGDIKTIASLGGYAVTVVTTVAVQNHHGVLSTDNIPESVVDNQLTAVLCDIAPLAVKIGLMGCSNSAQVIVKHLTGFPNIVYAPGFESANGEILDTDGKVDGVWHSILSITKILVMKLGEVEMMYNEKYESRDEVIAVARKIQKMGCKNILLYGCNSSEGLITSVMLREDGGVEFFSLNDTDSWKTHGLGAALSAAVATFLGRGLGVVEAVKSAHEYVRSLVLYSVELRDGFTAQLLHRSSTVKITERQAEIYNKLMQLVACHYKKRHDVAFYSEQLCVSGRYLGHVTRHIVGKSPKKLIHEYIVKEAAREIVSTQQTIQSIAYKFGFVSQSQFSNFFKLYYGRTPIELREKKH